MTEEYNEPFKLTKEEIESPLWKRLEAYYQDRLARARSLNDNPKPEDRTNLLRGHIAAYKDFLDLGKLPGEE